MKRIMNVIKVLKTGSNDSRMHIYTHKTLGFSACHDKIKG